MFIVQTKRVSWRGWVGFCKRQAGRQVSRLGWNEAWDGGIGEGGLCSRGSKGEDWVALRQVSTVCCAGLKGAGGKSGASGKQGAAGRQKVYWVVVEAGCWVVRPQAVAGRARSLESIWGKENQQRRRTGTALVLHLQLYMRVKVEVWCATAGRVVGSKAGLGGRRLSRRGKAGADGTAHL